MFFNTADIIVLVIMLVLLFVNRRFDKNNRSLENVRNYSVRIKKELDELVKEKKIEIHDLNLNIEVQVKKNDEILKRVIQVNEESFHRSKELEIFQDKLTEATGRLEELDVLIGNVDVNMQRIKEESKYVDTVGARLHELIKTSTDIKASVESLLKEFQEENARGFCELKDSFNDEMAELYKHHGNELGKAASRLEEFRNHVEDLLKQRDAIARDKLDAYTSQWISVEKNYKDRLEKTAFEGEKLESDAFLHLKELLSSHSEILSSRWETEAKSLEKRFQNTMDEMSESMAELDEGLKVWKKNSEDQMAFGDENLSKAIREQHKTQESMKGDLEQMKQDLSASRNAVSRQKNEVFQELEELSGLLNSNKMEIQEKLEDFSSGLTQKIENAAETLQLESLKAVEKKLKDFEGEFYPRFQKLEYFISDMDTLENTLYRSMDEIQERVLGEFKTFDLKMQNLRSDEERNAEEQTRQINNAMRELEKGLDDLKSRAYDNVSAQLQVFEDDFFANLKKRDTVIQENLKEWQLRIEDQLKEMEDQQVRDRQEMVRTSNGEMNKALGELQTKVSQQFEKFREQVEAFQESLDGRVAEGNSRIADYTQELHNSIIQLHDESMNTIIKELDRFSSTMNERVEGSQKDLIKKMDLLFDNMEQSKQDFHSRNELLHNELKVWKEKIQQQMKDEETSIRESYGEFSTAVFSDLDELRDDFKLQKEELILSSNEERSQLKRELSVMDEKVHQLQNDLKDKSASTLERFNSDYNLFMLDFQKKIRESQNDAELKIREMRQGVGDAREKMDAYQKKLTNRVEEDTRHLMKNLEEIEKKQQEFIAQTHVFEKADHLKETLSRNIAELKGELQKVDSNMDRLKDYQSGFERVQSQYQDVLNQIKRIMDEKQKVEELEERIKNMTGLSNSVDLKLDQITVLHDMLQQYQSRVKEMEDQYHMLDARFVKMEGKAALVESTGGRVDDYIQIMESFKGKLKEIKDDLEPLGKKLETMEQQNKYLLDNKENVAAVHARIASMDQVLADLDEKTQKINQAREWIANTETRMDSVVKQAQNQVKLLGRLADKEGIGRGGSPDMNTREMVLRLARLGWKADNIAQILKLSQGEVELILEITPRS